MAQYEWPENLAPAPLKMPKEAGKLLTKCKTPLEAPWMLLSTTVHQYPKYSWSPGASLNDPAATG